MNNLRRRKRGQSLVIIALSATVLFGIIALGLDAGRLYFQRRDVQNAADGGALAGAQELIPRGIGVNGDPVQARCKAAEYAFKLFNDTPQHDCSNTTYWNQATTVSDTAVNDTAPTVRVTTPSRGNPNEIETEVIYNTPTTFAAVLGFRNSNVYGVAYAHGGFVNKVYTIFGFDATGSGNSVNYDQNGYAQVDNGNGGSDCDLPDPTLGKIVSNAKFHSPNPNNPFLNMNGDFHYPQGSDTHALQLYWQFGVNPATVTPDSPPGYEPPQMPSNAISWAPTYPGGVKTWVFSPGYSNSAINIPFAGPGDANAHYVFQNGVYYFNSGGLNITGGIVGNTSDGLPKYDGNNWGKSDLGVGPDGVTNGVEFVFDGSSSFSATGGGAPRIFFVAPSVTASGTDSIAFFITQTNTIPGPSGTPFVETIDGTKPGANFQVWGTIMNKDNNYPHGTNVVLTAVQSTGGINNTGRYAVTGEIISPQVDLNGGNLVPATTPTTPSTCTAGVLSPGKYRQNPAGLLVQFNPNFAPHFRGFSFLVR